MIEIRSPSEESDFERPNTPEPNTHGQIQFPLSVFFELTGIVAIAFMFSNAIGWLSAVGLCFMALSILLRSGMAAVVSFGMALIVVSSGENPAGYFVCLAMGGLIACWPIARAAVLRRRETAVS